MGQIGTEDQGIVFLPLAFSRAFGAADVEITASMARTE
jgi:hypothetical protein